MHKLLETKKFVLFILIIFILNSCAKGGFFKTGDARKVSPDPRERVKKNLEEGKGFRINDAIKGGRVELLILSLVSSNGLWRAS